MFHTVEAGPDSRQATWRSTTGKLDGDPKIVLNAMTTPMIVLHPEEGPHNVDWTNGDTAIPTLKQAAREAYGEPLVYFVVLEPGEQTPPEFLESTSPARDDEDDTLDP